MLPELCVLVVSVFRGYWPTRNAFNTHCPYKYCRNCVLQKSLFRFRLTLACMVLLLAMWACAASSTMKWGPDLTLELPPHVLQEALFGSRKGTGFGEYKREPIPSAPSELPYAPLLSNEQPVGTSKPAMKTFGSPAKAFSPSSIVNMNAPVLVLPPRIVPQHKVKPVFYKFSTEEPA